MKINLLHFLAILAVVIFVSCNTSKREDGSQNGGEIKIDGSSTVYPITEAIAEEFRVTNPDVKVTIGISGTGGGFKKFSRGETDINDASRPIKGEEIVACDTNGIKYVELRVAYDGLAVVVNKGNTWVDFFTLEELKKMWEPAAQEKVMRWNQIREGWPDEPFHLYGPGIASGTYDYFTEVIVGKSGSSRGDFTASEDDNVLVQGISGDINSIGFFGLAYYEENRENLKLAGVDNGKAVVIPSIGSIKDGSYSPLARPIFIYISSQAALKNEVTNFVEFYLKNAPLLVEEVGYIPFTDEEYTVELNKYKSFVQSLQ